MLKQATLDRAAENWGFTDPALAGMTKKELFAKAEQFERDENLTEAIRHFNPILAVALTEYQKDPTNEQFKGAIAHLSDRIARLHLRRECQSGDLWAAINYNLLMKVQPDRKYIYPLMARCYESVGDLRNALDAYKSELQLQPEHHTLRKRAEQLEDLLNTTGYDNFKYHTDVEFCRAAIAHDPNHPWAYFFLGISLHESPTMIDEAAEAYQKAAEVNPKNFLAHERIDKLNAKAEEQMRASEKSASAAAMCFFIRLAEDPERNWSCFYLGMSQEAIASFGNRGHIERAKEFYEGELDLNPGNRWAAARLKVLDPSMVPKSPSPWRQLLRDVKQVLDEYNSRPEVVYAHGILKKVYNLIRGGESPEFTYPQATESLKPLEGKPQFGADKKSHTISSYLYALWLGYTARQQEPPERKQTFSTAVGVLEEVLKLEPRFKDAAARLTEYKKELE